jgi:hypothetical protein
VARISGARQILAAARAEPAVLTAALATIREWLGLNEEAVIPPDTSQPPSMGQWLPPSLWSQLVEERFLPTVRQVWEDQWRATWRTQRSLSDPSIRVVDHLRSVASRLRDFATESFEIVREELLDGVSRGESIPQLRDRVGMALDIDAPSRALLNQIMEADAVLADPTSTAGEREAARASRSAAYAAQDAADRQWQWRAERIARTETISAFAGGTYSSALEQQTVFGERLGLQWWATRDTRTRDTHRRAHMQTVPVGERFRVGNAFLLYPGDPTGPAGEVINCRCVPLEVDLA